MNKSDLVRVGDEDLMLIGKISGVYGVRGWVKIFSDTSPRENILGYNPWMLNIQGQWQERKLLQGRPQGKGIVAQIEGVNDRDIAHSLIGTPIAMRCDRLPSLKEGDYYWRDLIGLKVQNLEGVDLGTVDHLIETGANDVLVLKGDEERLIPFVIGPVVQNIDLDARSMTVDWQADY
jgi:16S rRNA processing protein RimM